ncbi:hypothetical protein PaeBR_17615 [Paenibacillus sp. BR2-3]|uniref:hypothetical protein n=1 Tax=Paenibacillus sp. BR2-3 TaxID=3048494 RepID=UPI0039779DAF
MSDQIHESYAGIQQEQHHDVIPETGEFPEVRLMKNAFHFCFHCAHNLARLQK